jgi:hypothetical protein
MNMKIILLTVSAILVTGAIGVLFFRRNRKVETDGTENEAETPVSAPSETKVVLEESIKRSEKIVESVEEMAKRLENLSSADKDKPFAKMSKPSVSEVPVVSETISPETEEAPKPKPKKKRPYKKKTSPKKTEE